MLLTIFRFWFIVFTDISGDEVLPNLPDICASVQFSIAQHICRRLQRGMEFLDRKKMLPENDRKLVK